MLGRGGSEEEGGRGGRGTQDQVKLKWGGVVDEVLGGKGGATCVDGSHGQSPRAGSGRLATAPTLPIRARIRTHIIWKREGMKSVEKGDAYRQDDD